MHLTTKGHKVKHKGSLREIQLFFFWLILRIGTWLKNKKYSDIYKLNILGTPNVISKLFFGMNFKIYSTSLLNFYYKITIKNIENILRNRNSKEVFMFIFKNLSSHLYVYHDISDDNTLNVFDISDFEIKETNISTSEIYILFRLDLSSIKDV